MSWIIVALLNPLLHGAANVFDNYLTNRMWKNTGSLIFYATIMNVLFTPFVLIFGIPKLPPLTMIPAVIVTAALDLLYLLPYYRALQNEDTSNVSSLFSLGYLFTPVLAFLLVHELLTASQYIGFAIVIFASVVGSISSSGPIRINRALFYMVLAGIIVGAETVMYKYLFTEMSWNTGFIFEHIAAFLIMALLFLCSTALRNSVRNSWAAFKKVGHLFAAEECLTMAGSGAVTYAIALAPVTVVQSIGATQPFFVLLYAMLFSRLFPKLFRERIDRKSIVRKVVVFAVMLVGVCLTIGFRRDQI